MFMFVTMTTKAIYKKKKKEKRKKKDIMSLEESGRPICVLMYTWLGWNHLDKMVMNTGRPQH